MNRGVILAWCLLSSTVLSVDVSSPEETCSQLGSVSSAADSSCQKRPDDVDALEQIHAWWETMSEQRPVKCRDKVWAAEPEELNTGARELVFKVCSGGHQQRFEVTNVGKF